MPSLVASLVFFAAAVSTLVNASPVAGAIVYPTGWTTLASCAVDTPARILLAVKIVQFPTTNSINNCMSYCSKLGYIVAGVEYGNECHCGRGLAPGWQTASTSDCNTNCTSTDSGQLCGGAWRIQLYSTTPTVAINPPLPSGWASAYPCAVDTGDRILTNNLMTTSRSNTPLQCANFCMSKGYQYAGVEWGVECHCGTGYKGKITTAEVRECYFDCSGSTLLDCGGDWRIQLYYVTNSTLALAAANAAAGATTTATTTTTTTSTSSAATASATIYGQCGGATWTGPTTCPSGWVCTYSNAYYSQCLAGTSSSKNTAYAQCGGLNFSGDTSCPTGYYCQYQNSYFSQCVPN